MEHLSFSLGPVSRHDALDEIFNDLAAAITQKRICKIVYLSFLEKNN